MPLLSLFVFQFPVILSGYDNSGKEDSGSLIRNERLGGPDHRLSKSSLYTSQWSVQIFYESRKVIFRLNPSTGII